MLRLLSATFWAKNGTPVVPGLTWPAPLTSTSVFRPNLHYFSLPYPTLTYRRSDDNPDDGDQGGCDYDDVRGNAGDNNDIRLKSTL